MTIIRAICPSCGKVEMGAAAISLEVSVGAGLGQYRFACPTCLGEVSRQADRQGVAMLMAAGVTPSIFPVAATEVPAADRGRNGDAPPFTLDDSIAFHFLLQDETLIADLLDRWR